MFIVLPFAIVSISWLYLALGGAEENLADGVAALGVAGFFSGAFSVMITLCKEMSPRELTGSAIAMLNTFGFLGIAISTPLYGTLIELFSPAVRPSHKAAVLLMAGMSIAGCVISFFFTESGGRNMS